MNQQPLALFVETVGGVIRKQTVVAGLSKVFLDKHAHTMLEAYRFHLLTLCTNKIGSPIMKVIGKKRSARKLSAVVVIQRIVRGFLARRKYKQMTSPLPVAQQVIIDTSPLVAAVEVMAEELPIAEASNERSAFTVEDFKIHDAVVQEEMAKIIATHKVTDADVYLNLDVNVYKVVGSMVIDYSSIRLSY